MAKWMVTMKKSDFDATAARFGIRNITARLLTNRGLTNDQDIERYLNGDKSMLHDPKQMQDMEKGASIMLERIAAKSHIRVIGDYDVDGICSTYILVKGLRLFGADVDYVLPDRIKDGYGLSVKLVDNASADGRDTIITCDNGIAAAEQVAHAKELGMTVIVTDHHEVPLEVSEAGFCESYKEARPMADADVDPDRRKADMAFKEARPMADADADPDGRKGDVAFKEILPVADAVIDPKRREGNVAFKEICGAVVAYKFLQVMAEISGHKEDEIYTDFFDEMLIFAGIATVCDVMELKDENRIIVKESLKRIAHTNNRGLKALINVNGLDPDHITAYNYGFVIGPCLNATGRLDLASRAMSLFLEEDENEAAKEAVLLKEMNDNRKTLTVQGVNSAAEIIDGFGENIPRVLVIYLPEVHESIAGIIAGRIKEKYYRPTIVITKAADGGAKGSGRSIDKYDMFTELSKCKELFTKFGGHKMAAGLSLPEENIDILRERLNSECVLTKEDLEPVLHLDMQLPFKYIDMDLIREFGKLEPFGTGNTKPLFAQKDVRLISGALIGKNKNFGKYKVTDESGRPYEMMYFGDIDNWNSFLKEKFGESAVESLYDNRSDGSMAVSIAYYPSINSYRGKESIQIVMSDYT